jgi:hypothetical protein
MRTIRLLREQYRIAKLLGVPIRPLNKQEKMQLAKSKDEKNYWLLVILVSWLLLIVSIIVWK